MRDVVAVVMRMLRRIDVVDLLCCSYHRRAERASWCHVARRDTSLEDVEQVIIKVVYRIVLREGRGNGNISLSKRRVDALWRSWLGYAFRC